MRVLVTGCAGYIGSVLTGELLARNHHVMGVDDLIYGNFCGVAPYVGHPRFEFHRLDIRNINRFGRMVWWSDAVIHLAALVGAPVCEKYAREAIAINDVATAELMKNTFGYHRIIYPNTNSGYGRMEDGSPVTEESPLRPLSVYGTSKSAGEQHVLRHHNSVVLRLATVFGVSPRMRLDLMVNDFVKRVNDYLCGRSPYGLTLYEPHFRRNFIHVRDVADAMVFLLENDRHRGVFNLGNDALNMTKQELALAVCERMGCESSLVREGTGRDPDQRDYLVSSEKIQRTGFRCRYGLKTGIDEVALYCRSTSPEEQERARNA